MCPEDGSGHDVGRSDSHIDGATLAVALGAVTPYCDVIKARLIDIADNNTHAAVSTIARLGEIDALTDGLCDDVRNLATTATQLRAALPDTESSGGVGAVIDRLIERDQRVLALADEVRALRRHAHAAVELGRELLALGEEMLTADEDIGTVDRCEDETISDRMRSLAERVGAVEQRLDAGADHVAEQLDLAAQTAQTQRLRDLVDRQQQLADLVNMVAATSEETAAQTMLGVRQLSDRGTAALAEMQFEDVGRQMIMRVVGALDDLRDQLIRLHGYAHGEVTSEAVRAGVREVDGLKRRHVRDAHRTTHASAAAAPPVSTALHRSSRADIRPGPGS